MAHYKFKGCEKCGGDLVYDWWEEWHCVQCGKLYHQSLALATPKLTFDGRHRAISHVSELRNTLAND
ncbi:MAG: hypothetical protein ACREBU_00155 [Nitrososphaera sp.]